MRLIAAIHSCVRSGPQAPLRLALLACACAVHLAVAEYMYRPPPHLMPHPVPHHHKHHPYSASKHGPSRHPPPSLYHGRPHHRPRKPPPPPQLAAASPWKNTPYKTTKDPFRTHGSDPDFGNQAAVLSAIKTSGSPLTSITSSPLVSSLSVRPGAHASALHTYTNIVSDDHGPIHTIPAPNLGPADNPGHSQLSESSSYGSALEQHAIQRQAIQSALHQLHAAQAARPAGPTTAAPTPAVLHYTQGYQVSESPAAGQHEGVAMLYAPDPDPSRPTRPVKLTTDPHSLPSEGRGPQYRLAQRVIHHPPADTAGALLALSLSHSLGAPYSIDPQYGAVASQPGHGFMSVGPTLSPQDLFHLLNGFPLQGLQGLSQDVHPQVHIMHPDHQHLILQQQQQQHLQQLQQQHLHQQLQAQVQAQAQQLHHHLHPQYQSFDFDEQSYQKSVQDHEVSEDAPRPSLQRPDSSLTQEPSPSASTVTLFTVAPPQPTASSPVRGDIRSQDDADAGREGNDDDDDDDGEEYDDAPAPSRTSSTTQSGSAVTPRPQATASQEDDADDLQQTVIREEAGTYSSDPSLVTPFRRQPNSVHVPDVKPGRIPYGARIRPKRIAVE
ncbi:Halomucin [Frankliniella fusca]|uniref:Halomucin n=1 Tax=Frankliniella fusca TaxID=407009 RepID=A0AAE1H3B4_9NEOP|nr:Halomucin [Frankliniella fusca]